jgi:predicted PurR-regulated permease PerM
VDKNRIETISLLVLFAGISLLLFYVFSPFLQVLALAAVFAVIFQNSYKKLRHFFFGSKTASAAVIVALVLIFIITPLFLLGIEIFREAQGLYVSAQGNGAQYLGSLQSAIETPIQHLLPGFTIDINTYVGNALAFISSNLASLVYQTFFVVFETFLMLVAFFFFLRDGEELLANTTGMSPFGDAITADILRNMRLAVQSVVKGTILIAIFRWLLVGIGFYLFGIPNAILWGSVGGIVGAIPAVGTAFVFIPAIAFLLIQHKILLAVGLTIFAVIALVLLDNVLTPYYFSKGLEAPQIIILFSILGGIIFFGPLGFIFGPLVLSVFISILHVYSGTTPANSGS